MEAISKWLNSWREIGTEHFQSFVDYLPSLLGAIALLILGWLVARFLRIVVRRLGNGINQVLDGVLAQGHLDRVRLSAGALRVSETLVYWIAVLFLITEAAGVAKLQALASWLERVFAFVPSIIGAGTIMLVGYIISTLVRDVVAASMPLARGPSDDEGEVVHVPALIAQGATFLIAVLVGIDQLGVNVTFLITVIAIVLSGALLSLALAFGFGASTLVSNLIGARELRQHYALGQTVRIEGIDGEILEFTATSVIVGTADGRVMIPAKVFNEKNTTLVVPQA